jgi:hypothetical protein
MSTGSPMAYIPTVTFRPFFFSIVDAQEIAGI